MGRIKVDMAENPFLWVTFDEPNKEIIVDRETNAIRIHIGNDVIKIGYLEDSLRGILLRKAGEDEGGYVQN